MAFTLENLGIKIKKSSDISFREKVIDFCISKVNGDYSSISPQLLLANKELVTDDLIEVVNTQLSRNMISKRKYLIKRIKQDNIEKIIHDFITNYTQAIKSLDITFGLSDDKQPLNSFGNSKFVIFNIELLTDIILFNPKIKKLLNMYITNNIFSNKDSCLLSFLHKFEKYNVVVFDELSQVIIKWTENSQFQIIPDQYPDYLKKICELEELIKKVFIMRKFIKKHFPKKDYSDVYIPIYNKIYNKIDEIIVFKNVGSAFVSRFLENLHKQLSFLNDSKKKYYENQLTNKINTSFRNVDNLDDYIDYLQTYIDFPQTQEPIAKLFIRHKNDKIFRNIFDTVVELPEKLISVFSNLSLAVLKQQTIMVRIKVPLAEYIWDMRGKDYSKILMFCNRIDYSKASQEYKIINSIIKDKIHSEGVNMFISPHKVYHFTRGVWDFPMDNEYFSHSAKDKNVFSEELNAIVPNFDSIHKKMIVFTTKGKMSMELSDGTNKIMGTFLPIQGFIIKKLIKAPSEENELQQMIILLGVSNYEKVLRTLSDIIEKKDKIYRLKEKLTCSGEINFADRYFMEVKKVIEEKIERELVLGKEEILSSNIASITKKQEDNKIKINDLYKKLEENVSVIEFNKTDVKRVIKYMVKREFITKTDDEICYITY